jgi:hypothetical protein
MTIFLLKKIMTPFFPEEGASYVHYSDLVREVKIFYVFFQSLLGVLNID